MSEPKKLQVTLVCLSCIPMTFFDELMVSKQTQPFVVHFCCKFSFFFVPVLSHFVCTSHSSLKNLTTHKNFRSFCTFDVLPSFFRLSLIIITLILHMFNEWLLKQRIGANISRAMAEHQILRQNWNEDNKLFRIGFGLFHSDSANDRNLWLKVSRLFYHQLSSVFL